MALKLGTSDVAALRLGADTVAKLMLGAAQVWPVAGVAFEPVLLAEGETGATFTPTTSHVISGIGSVTPGDLIVVFVGLGGGGGATSLSIDTGASGANWTIRNQGSRTTSCVLACITKTAEGSDALTLTSSATSYGVWQAWRIPGGASGIYAGTGVSNYSSIGEANPPALSPAGGSLEYIWMAACAVGANTTLTSGPASYSTPETTINSFSPTNGGKLAVAWKVATASTDDPASFVWGAAINFYANTFAFAE